MDQDSRNVHLMDAEIAVESTPDPVLLTGPSEAQVEVKIEEDCPSEGLYYINNKGERRKLPPYIRYDDGKSGRIGWAEKPPLICYACYEEGHTSPQCPLKLSQLDQVVTNYEKLSDSDRKNVPGDAYKRAQAYLNFRKEETPAPKPAESKK